MMPHPGQLVVDLGHDGNQLPSGLALTHGWNKINHRVRITAQAHPLFAFRMRGDHLPHHIDPLGHEVAHRVGVVGADVVLLLLLI